MYLGGAKNEKVTLFSEEYGIDLNVNRSRYMMSRKNTKQAETVYNQLIERKAKIAYRVLQFTFYLRYSSVDHVVTFIFCKLQMTSSAHTEELYFQLYRILQKSVQHQTYAQNCFTYGIVLFSDTSSLSLSHIIQDKVFTFFYFISKSGKSCYSTSIYTQWRPLL